MRAMTGFRARALVTATAAAALLASAPGALAHGQGGNGHQPGHPPSGRGSHGDGPAGPPSAALASVQGVVQFVGQRALTLRLLDGSTVTVALDRHTRVLVGGAPASLSAVRAGEVVEVSAPGAGPALELRVLLPG